MTRRPSHAHPATSEQALTAPFPYFGGKSKIAGDVWKRFGNPDTYVEPFGGSLAVLLARPNEHEWWAKKETVGDYSGHVVNVYRALQQDPDAVARHASWPVFEADLTARHLWLVRRSPDLADRLAADPDYCDVRAAGWWIWGVSAWVGGEWCSGLGPWHPGSDTGPGVYRKMPMVAGNHGGKGIHKPLPAGDVPLGEDGFPQVDQAYRDALVERFARLSARLRRVRITCGDWARLTKSASVPAKNRIAGVFLDPPYDPSLRRGDLYGPTDRGQDAASAPHVAAREWALARGADPSMRIAYCGYSHEDEDRLFTDAGWTPFRWTASGGYGLQADNQARDNRRREIVWFSPQCLPAADDESNRTSHEGALL